MYVCIVCITCIREVLINAFVRYALIVHKFVNSYILLLVLCENTTYVIFLSQLRVNVMIF
jgi:hypothetical protein